MSIATPSKFNQPDDDRAGQAVVDYLDEALGRHGGRWPEFDYSCPFCVDRIGTESYKRKLGVNVAKGAANCFRCGYAVRTLEQFLRDVKGGKLGVVEKDLIAGYTRVSVDSDDVLSEVMIALYGRDAQQQQDVSKSNENLTPFPLPPEYVPLGMTLPENPIHRRGWNYAVIDRGVDPVQLQWYAVGYCPSGRYAQRLIFPVFIEDKQVYFTTRYCGDYSEVKGLNPENLPWHRSRDTVLWNYDRCVGAPVVAVVEGALSGMAFDYTGIPACGMLGKRLADEQMSLLERLAAQGTHEFVLGVDPDASEDAGRLFEQMTDRLPLVTYLPLRGGDPWDERHKLSEILRDRREITVEDRVSGINFHAWTPRRQKLLKVGIGGVR